MEESWAIYNGREYPRLRSGMVLQIYKNICAFSAEYYLAQLSFCMLCAYNLPDTYWLFRWTTHSSCAVWRKKTSIFKNYSQVCFVFFNNRYRPAKYFICDTWYLWVKRAANEIFMLSFGLKYFIKIVRINLNAQCSIKNEILCQGLFSFKKIHCKLTSFQK